MIKKFFNEYVKNCTSHPIVFFTATIISFIISSLSREYGFRILFFITQILFYILFGISYFGVVKSINNYRAKQLGKGPIEQEPGCSNGCGIGCLLFILLAIIVSFFSWTFGFKI